MTRLNMQVSGERGKRFCLDGFEVVVLANSVKKYREENVKVLSFLVGQVMKATSGKANSIMVNDLLKRKIS